MKSISIVIPALNEEGNIKDVVLDSIRVLRSVTDRYEILVMDDASRDRTGAILDELSGTYPGIVRVFHHAVNQGTNLSLIELFREAKNDWIFFLPADRQILPDSIHAYLAAADEGVDVVLGWRAKRADPIHRNFFNWAYRIAIKLLLGVYFHDATASDLYRKKILDEISLDSRGRLLQAEIAIKARLLGYQVKEIPVDHYPRRAGKQTGIKLKTLWLSFEDLIQTAPKIKKLARGMTTDSARPQDDEVLNSNDKN